VFMQCVAVIVIPFAVSVCLICCTNFVELSCEKSLLELQQFKLTICWLNGC